MADHELKYNQMVEDALRSVVGRALSHAAERGLSGDHHFYITFLTDHPGVAIPDHLRSQYPSEMTIVLQHQFWGLEVGPETFGVTLSFANQPERLTVPYAAVSAFADPSVRFFLQFNAGTGELKPGEDDQVVPADHPLPETGAANVRPLVHIQGVSAKVKFGPSPPDGPPDPGGESEKVVTLDAFRKSDDQPKT